MRFLDKLVPYEQLAKWRAELAQERMPVVATNGCFDILHPGHVFLLERARTLGRTLIVGVTGDAGVRALKGPTRPALPENDRVLMLCSVECVTHVCLFPEVGAVGFLQKCRPDVYVKGGDYTLETINQEERGMLEAAGVRIEILPKFGDQSSSKILQRIEENRRVHP
jgi:rfaE bifunctional protein nucleotidyltransferase chain/domain